MNEMRSVRSLVVAALAPVVLVAPAVVFADGRLALVVGNGIYTHIGRLLNPDNDARDMSAALRLLGFEVTTEFDADRVEQTEALRTFMRQSVGRPASDRCTGTVAGWSETTGKRSAGFTTRPTGAIPTGRLTSVRWTYENGRGVQRDRVDAVRWYRRAAEQGDSWAQESRKNHHTGPILHVQFILLV